MRFSKPLIPLSLLALSGCEYFHPTTVPSSDTTAPWAAVSLYYDGDHQELLVGNKTQTQAANEQAFNHVTTDPYESFIALGAGVDSGGIREVRMHTRVFARCVYGPANVHVLEPWAQRTITQAGSPGDTVDNGLYLFKGFRGYDYIDHLDFCSDDNHQVTLEWSVSTRDFHNNWAYYGLGKVTYVRFGS